MTLYVSWHRIFSERLIKRCSIVKCVKIDVEIPKNSWGKGGRVGGNQAVIIDRINRSKDVGGTIYLNTTFCGYGWGRRRQYMSKLAPIFEKSGKC